MQVKVWCPEPIVTIEKEKEEYFYKELKSKFSKRIIDMIQEEKKYKVILEEFLYTYRIEL